MLMPLVVAALLPATKDARPLSHPGHMRCYLHHLVRGAYRLFFAALALLHDHLQVTGHHCPPGPDGVYPRPEHPMLALVQAQLAGLSPEQRRVALWSHEETGNDWTFRRDRQVAAWCRERGVVCYAKVH
jgi:hypothetical protein